MKQYETMVIVDAMISDDAINKELETIQNTITSGNGEIIRIDNWGKRKMAYAINKKTHGSYAVFYYNAEEAVPGALEKDFRINENVLRWMTLKDQVMPEAPEATEEATEEVAAAPKSEAETVEAKED